MEKLEFQRISEEAIAPSKATKFSVGWDLAVTRSAILYPREIKKINLDLKLKFPSGVYGRIASRSGLALKGILTLGGVVDPDYRGNVAVILTNISNIPYEISAGDKIAQLILEKYSDRSCVEVKEMPTTERGENGFGSTVSSTLEISPLMETEESEEEGEVSSFSEGVNTTE